jgi:hypothetical protein
MKTIKTKIFSLLVIIAASIALFFACKKTNSTGSNPPPEDLVTASVAGRVTDLSNVPVSNASVTAGAVTTTTDANGQFTIKNAQLDKDAGFVKVTMQGYFNGSRTFVTSANAVNNVKIQLIPKLVSGSFTVASGGNVNVSGGGTVNFIAKSVVNATTNAAYTGDVSVSTFYLNPADANFNQFMPGDLRGINTSNQQSILKVFGMASIEMNNAAGEKLQLAAGKKATIVLPIPSTLQSSAPATIALWYFDETKGLWKEEGVATKQNNTYVGTVAHFSFWAAGQLAQSIKLEATFKDSSGLPLSNNLVTITSSKYGATNGYTDSSGTISGLVPSNDSLVLKVFNQNGEIYSQPVGPFVTDTNLGVIIIEIPVVVVSDSNYIHLTLDGVSYSWMAPSDSLSGQKLADTSGFFYTYLQGGTPFNNSAKSISLDISTADNEVPGSYNLYIYTTLNDVCYTSSFTGHYSLTTTVTEYGTVNGYITGTSSGYMSQCIGSGTDNAIAIPFTCSYRVKRSQ